MYRKTTLIGISIKTFFPSVFKTKVRVIIQLHAVSLDYDIYIPSMFFF